MDFKDKVVIVTGASSGIGLSCAEQIISYGGCVIGVDKSEAVLDYVSHYTDMYISGQATLEEVVEDLQATVTTYLKR